MSSVKHLSRESALSQHSTVDHQEDGRGDQKVTGLQGCSHQAFELSVRALSTEQSNVKGGAFESSIGTSGQCLTVDRGEDRQGGRKVMGLQYQVFELSVGASSIPTSKVHQETMHLLESSLKCLFPS
jgi:hypothetical protein